MDPVQYFSASRLLVVAGKGGVGKTTVTAVVARAAARAGLHVLVVDVAGRAGLAGLLGGGDDEVFGYSSSLIAEGCGPSGTGRITGCFVDPGSALRDYLATHGFGRIAGRLAAGGVLDVMSTAAPGIEDILVIGKIKQLERAGDVDLIVLDAPAAGHAITFLQAAQGLIDSVRVGPIQAQARDVADLLADPTRCQVMLVTLAEPTPVNEVIETAFALEDRVGVALAPIVVNALYPPGDLPDDRTAPVGDPSESAAASLAALVLESAEAAAAASLAALVLESDEAAAADFRRRRVESQTAQVAALADRLPLPQIRLDFVFTAGLTAADVDRLATDLLEQIEALA